MNCPACAGKALAPSRPRTDLAVDLCAACGGAWLDKGEIYAFTRRARELHDELGPAYRSAKPSKRRCPRCAVAMHEVSVARAGVTFEACGSCGGNWFDRGEAAKLTAEVAPLPPQKDYGPAVMAALIGSCAAAAIAAAWWLGREAGYPLRARHLGPTVAAAAALMLAGHAAAGRRR